MSEFLNISLNKCLYPPESGTRPKGGIASSDGDIPSFGGENIIQEGGVRFYPVRKTSRDFFSKMNRGHLKDGDVLINKDGANTGKVGIYRNYPYKEASINEHLFILRGKEGQIDQTFLYYLLLSSSTKKIIEMKITGSAQPGLNSTFVNNFPVLLPPLPEQQKIASILTSVDAVIEKTEAQINKLKDLKKAMMQELLTKGIGHTEFKDSPVGKIPRSWEVRKLINCCELMTNGYVGATRDIYVKEGIPYVLCQNIRPDHFVDTVYKQIGLEFHNNNKRSWLKKGDVLTVQTGAGNGDSCVVPKKYEGTNCHALIISRPKKELLISYYLSAFLGSDRGRNRIQIMSTGGAHPHLNTTELRKEFIALPPLGEQQNIASILTSADNNIYEKQRKLSHTKSLKKALMQDLLTGKVRVAV